MTDRNNEGELRSNHFAAQSVANASRTHVQPVTNQVAPVNQTSYRSHFNSNDGTALQNRLRELQAELELLDQEEKELENESELIQEETESIKRHNKALFDQIATNQEKNILAGGASQMHASNDIGMPQNSLFSANNDSMNQESG